MRIIPVIASLLVLIGVGAESQVPPTNEKKQVEQKTTERPKNTAKKPAQDAAVGARVTETEVDTLAHCCQVCTQNSEENKGLISKLNDPTAIFTGLLVLATFALWWATRKLVLGAESTAEQQLRAYVFFRQDDKVLNVDEKGCLNTFIVTQNFGQTPASNLITSLQIGIYKIPLDVELPRPIYPPTASKTILAPSEQVRQFVAHQSPLDKVGINAIIAGEYAIFVHGELLYTDVFSHKRYTRFCLYSTGNDFSNGRFAYYHEGNDAN